MSAVAVSPRPHPPVRPARVAPVRPRSAPTLTITLDLPLGGPLTPRLARLVDLLGELVEAGEGRLRPEPAGAQESGPRTGWILPGAAPAPGWAGGSAPDEDPAVPSGVPSSETLLILAGSRVVRRGAREVPLTRIEFDLLLYLAEHPRKVFTRLQLLASVWGYEHAVARTVDVHVRRLRAKLGADTPLVTTVHGVGYRLADEARIVVHRQH